MSTEESDSKSAARRTLLCVMFVVALAGTLAILNRFIQFDMRAELRKAAGQVKSVFARESPLRGVEKTVLSMSSFFEDVRDTTGGYPDAVAAHEIYAQLLLAHFPDLQCTYEHSGTYYSLVVSPTSEQDQHLGRNATGDYCAVFMLSSDGLFIARFPKPVELPIVDKSGVDWKFRTKTRNWTDETDAP